MMICARCKIETEGAKNYGGYAIDDNVEYCLSCWEKWIEIVNRQLREREEFKKGGVDETDKIQRRRQNS